MYHTVTVGNCSISSNPIVAQLGGPSVGSLMRLPSKRWPMLQSFEGLAVVRKALLCIQCFPSPSQLHKEWALVLEHSRDKELTHPMLGLSLCVGKCFLVSCLVSTFSFLHNKCVSWHLADSSVLSTPLRKGQGPSAAA